MIIRPGMHDISNEEYHKPIGISRSGIMTFLKTPLHYWDKYINLDKPEIKKTDALIFGSALHTFVLEPEKFDSLFIVQPEYPKFPPAPKLKDTNREIFEEGKLIAAANEKLIDSLKKDFEMNSLNKDILDKDDFDKIKKMNFMLRNCVIEETKVYDLIEGAQYEKSLYWIDEETGILCKARPDILHNNMVCDLKSALHADLYSFQHAIRDYGYHIQCAYMQDGIKAVLGKVIESFTFIVIEKERPFAIAIYTIAEEAIQEGKKIYKQALLDIQKCTNDNFWPSYPINEASLPHLNRV